MRCSLAVFLSVTIAQTLTAAPVGSIAELVLLEDRAALVEQLAPALAGPDPRARATAARVVAVRGITELLGPVAEVLATETDLEAAREQLRALAISGDRAALERAFALSKRFSGRLDGDLATAIARRGAPDAVDLYFDKVRELQVLGSRSNYFLTALWGRPELATIVGSRLLAARDVRGWGELLDAMKESDLLLDLGVAVAALHMEAAPGEFAVPTAWYLARSIACEGERPGCRADFSPVGRQILMEELRETDSGPEALRFPRELLRRVLGMTPYDTPEALRAESPFAGWLASEEAETFLSVHDTLAKYMREDEWKAFIGREKVMKPFKVTGMKTSPVAPAVFRLPSELPRGVAAAVVNETGCRGGGWIGVAGAGVDERTRVSVVDLEKVESSKDCRRALEILLRMSLPLNTTMQSARVDPDNLLQVRAQGAELCLDERPVTAGGARESGPLRVGPTVTPPRVRRRVEPKFPRSGQDALRRANSHNVAIIAEALITREGCVRDVRLLTQSASSELNGAVVLAMSQWRFEPAKLDGVPVDVVFNLTVNFKSR